jgi:branched-chain amino acid transport system permease protein
MGFFFEVVLGGLLAGVLYSLVALGFVLIFKASGVFNFAQGAMVLFAALTLVRLTEYLPFWAAFAVSCAVMIGVAFVIERVVLRRLVNQEGIILFMATLGIAFFLERASPGPSGAVTSYTLDLGIPKDPSFILESIFEGGLLVDKLDVFAARGGWRAGGRPRVVFPEDQGRARPARGGRPSHGGAVHRCAAELYLAGGLVRLRHCRTRCRHGLGAKLGVQFSISLVALKALPVLILGGFTSVPGAIIGEAGDWHGEKLSEVYLGPILGGGIENWFAYMLVLLVLLVRPQGLFGDRVIERV